MSAPAPIQIPDPIEEAVPPGIRPEPLDQLHVERQRELERAARRQNFLARYGGGVGAQQGQTQPGQPQAPQEPEGSGGEGGSMGRAALDIGRGLVAIPRESAGGVFDAVQESAAAVKDLADLLPPLPGVIYEPGKGLRFASGKEVREVPGALETLVDKTIPDIDSSGTVTGGINRGVVKFLTGFLLAGKAKPLQALSRMGRAGTLAAPAVQGAISDFAAFDPQEERLSNLIQEFPALENPVTEYLAANPDDSAAEGRFKQALEGLGVGVAADGFVRGLRALRGMHAAKGVAGLDDTVTRQALVASEKQRTRMIEILGDPQAKAMEIRPPAATPAAGADQAGEVFINWSRINAHDDVKALIQQLADARGGNIAEAARGTRSWQATRLSAEQQNAWKILSERKVGQPLNAEQSVAVRELWVRSGARVKELAERVAVEGGELNEIAFQKQLAAHNAIQEQVVAARTETARALNSWAIRAGDAADFAGQMQQLRELTESLGRPKQLPGGESITPTQELAQRIVALSDSGDEAALDAFVSGSRLAKGSEMIRQLYYAALLSSAHTHARNLIGNSAVLPLQMLERRMAAMVGKAFGQQNVPDQEAMAQVFGALAGFRRAFRFTAKGRQVFRAARDKRVAGDPEAARELLRANADEVGTLFQSLASGQGGIGTGRWEAPRMGAFTSALEQGSPYARVAAWADTVTTAPMQALAASDEVFKTAAFDMELSALAMRRARQEVTTGKLTEGAVGARVAELLHNPDEYMRLASQQFAEQSTFSQRPGEFAQAASKLASKMPVLGRIILPFRTTPFNIASFTFRRTPMAPFVRQWREDVMAGGARSDIAWSQFVVGNAILATMADLALQGHITGVGPADPAEKAALQRQGWQPQSVRVRTGGTDANPAYRYFSYRGLEPLGTPLGLASNVVDILSAIDWQDEDAQYDELAIAASMAIAEQATSQQYMSGVSAFFEAMSDPQRYGENWWERLATAPIPRAVAQAARAQDSTLRMATDVGDAIRAQTPGLSKDLPPARDLWGRPISRASGLGTAYDLISPVYSTSNENAEPIDKELVRLETFIGMPGKRVTIGGSTVDLRNRPEVYSRFVQLAGNEAKVSIGGKRLGLMDALNALVTGGLPQSAMYRRHSDGPDGGKAEMIEELVDGYREAAKVELLGEFPDLRRDLDLKQAEKVQRLTPR